MTTLRWARRALLLFILIYLGSLAVGAFVESGSSAEAAFLVGIISIVGLVAASLVALAAQLALVVRSGLGKRITHG